MRYGCSIRMKDVQFKFLAFSDSRRYLIGSCSRVGYKVGCLNLWGHHCGAEGLLMRVRFSLFIGEAVRVRPSNDAVRKYGDQ